MVKKELKLDDILSYVSSELEKLKDVEDEKVKNVVENLNNYVSKISEDVKNEEPVQEEGKDKESEEGDQRGEGDVEGSDGEGKSNSSEEESSEAGNRGRAGNDKDAISKTDSKEDSEDNSGSTDGSDSKDSEDSEKGSGSGKSKLEETEKDQKAEEGKDSTEAQDKKDGDSGEQVKLSQDIVPENAIELSQEVSNKLKEAAIELDNLGKEIVAKDEIINGYKGKILELQKEADKVVVLSKQLDAFKEKEAIELKKKLDSKIDNLILLYKGLGITKNREEIELNFNETQIDKLANDLSVMKSPSKPVRQTAVTAGLELSKFKSNKKNDDMSDAQVAQALFDF